MKFRISSFSAFVFKLHRLSRRLWVRASLVAGLGLIAPFILGVLSPLVPDKVAEAISVEDVESIVEILASSMLAVTIFSLSVMLSARQSASSQVTPRSHQILLEDTTSQTVQATFLGAFVFSLFGMITLTTGYTSSHGAVVMLGMTLLVIALVVLAILRWIDHLTSLGSVLETTRRVEDAAQQAIRTRLEWPCLGARPLVEGETELPPGMIAVQARKTGYVQHIDLTAISEQAEEDGFDAYLAVQPGSFVSQDDVLMYHTARCSNDAISDSFTLGDARLFDQDPRFGVIVLSEIAQRALSSGLNDPGTAIDVITRLHRQLADYKYPDTDDAIEYPRVWMAPITADSLMHDGFEPIARDGAAMIEVQVRLQKALKRLANSADPSMAKAARAAAKRAMERAENALTLPNDLERLRGVYGPR
ncbi:DUF2254 domain-containing protein [Oceaniglobus ichthyenteri]|uniref:DUF2254 domain-containing protein n=1 Tax=Oceaniglobus ichthyenteri TaxID=2136177 RepID=UPI0013DDB0A7|nr:DUF2254 domain-containing protein [Oceaniglobus ichthyenteri]